MFVAFSAINHFTSQGFKVYFSVTLISLGRSDGEYSLVEISSEMADAGRFCV